MAQWQLNPAYLNQMRPQAAGGWVQPGMGFGGGPGYSLRGPGQGAGGWGVGAINPPLTPPDGRGMAPPDMGINPPQMPPGAGQGAGGGWGMPPPDMGINPPQMPPGGGGVGSVAGPRPSMGFGGGPGYSLRGPGQGGGGWGPGAGMPAPQMPPPDMGINPPPGGRGTGPGIGMPAPQMPPTPPGGWQGINPPAPRGGGGLTGNGNPLLSLQDLLGKYASWYQRPGGGANPPAPQTPPGGWQGFGGGPGYSLRGAGGNGNLYDRTGVRPTPDAPPGVVIAPPMMGINPPAPVPGGGFGGGPGYSLGGGVRFGENGQILPGRGGPGGAQALAPNARPDMGIGQPQMPPGGGAGGGWGQPGEMMGINPPKLGSIAPIGPGFGNERMTIQGGPDMGIMKQESPIGGSLPPPTSKYPPGYPGIGTIPGTGPLPPPTGPINGTVPTLPSPVIGPVNPNLPAPPGKAPVWPGYGGGAVPPSWNPPSTPKPGTTPPPTPTPKPGGGTPAPSNGGGWVAQPAPSSGGGGGPSAPVDNGFGPAPNAQQLAYMQYLWEQQQWGDKTAQDAAALAWQKDQFGQNLDWQKQQWGGEFGLNQDKFGLDVLGFGENQRQFDANYGLNQDRFGLDVLNFGEGNRRFDANFGEGQRQFDANFGLGQDKFGLDVLGFGQQVKQQDWQNQFSQDQFGWSKQMDTARNDIAKQNAAFAAFGRRFAPNVNVM